MSDAYWTSLTNDGNGTLLYLNHATGTDPNGSYDVSSGAAPGGVVAAV